MSETHPIPPADDVPHDATILQSTSYEVGSWRDGPVGSDAPVVAVMIQFNMRAADIAAFLLGDAGGDLRREVGFGIRIKSRGELDRLVRILHRHADDVWGTP